MHGLVRKRSQPARCAAVVAPGNTYAGQHDDRNRRRDTTLQIAREGQTAGALPEPDVGHHQVRMELKCRAQGIARIGCLNGAGAKLLKHFRVHTPMVASCVDEPDPVQPRARATNAGRAALQFGKALSRLRIEALCRARRLALGTNPSRQGGDRRDRALQDRPIWQDAFSKPLFNALVRSSERANAVRAAAGTLRTELLADRRYRAASSKPVHFWHAQVDDRDVWLDFFDPLQRGQGRGARRHLGAGGFENGPQQRQCIAVVVDREHPESAQVTKAGQRFWLFHSRVFAAQRGRFQDEDHQWQLHAKRRALTLAGSRDVDCAAVHFHDSRTIARPSPSPAVLRVMLASDCRKRSNT